jgi:quercetin dioxygenase-like cupin family protein
MHPAVRRAIECRTIGVVGDVYRFLATGAETSGAYALIDALVPPGGGPPPHVHSREVEGFFVLEGEVTFFVGEAKHVATAGAHVSVPIGTLHAFKNESAAPARMLILMTPAGLEEMFLEVGVALAAGATETAPPSHAEIERLLAAAPRYGVEILKPAT